MGQQTRDKMAGSGDPVARKESRVSSFALYQCLNYTNSFMTTNAEARIGCNRRLGLGGHLLWTIWQLAGCHVHCYFLCFTTASLSPLHTAAPLTGDVAGPFRLYSIWQQGSLCVPTLI